MYLVIEFFLNSNNLSLEGSLSSESEDTHDKYEEDLSAKYPPALRAILVDTKSSGLKLGSLFLVPYRGGSIGAHSAQNLIDLGCQDSGGVDKCHAVFGYDLSSKKYFIQGI